MSKHSENHIVRYCKGWAVIWAKKNQNTGLASIYSFLSDAIFDASLDLKHKQIPYFVKFTNGTWRYNKVPRYVTPKVTSELRHGELPARERRERIYVAVNEVVHHTRLAAQ